MRRMHLLEIHEQAWCPAAVRDGATDCLNMLANAGQQYRYALPLIRQALVATHSDRIVDLCSGGGGPWFSLARQLEAAYEQPVQIVLTDFYPSEPAMQRATRAAHAGIRYLSTPVDATKVPRALAGVRTLFTAFHHFSPPMARAVLQNAVDDRQGIAIFEQTRRNPLALLCMLVLPWIAVLTVPFMRPLRWSRLFWTYIIPAIPWVLCIDGIVSCLRTYSIRELQELVTLVNAPGYVWQAGRVPSPLSPIGVTWLLGYPADSADSIAAGLPRVARTK